MCEGTVQVILGDIFGRDIELERMDGLVDAESEEFNEGVRFLCLKWQLFDSVESGPVHVFCEWFK